METSLIDTVLTTISAHTIIKPLSNFAYIETRSAAHNATRSTRPMARPPSENAKDALDTVVSDDGVEHRYLPRYALRASLGRLKRSRAVGRRKPMAPKGAWQEAAPAR